MLNAREGTDMKAMTRLALTLCSITLVPPLAIGTAADQPDTSPVLVTRNAQFARSLERVSRRSARWREAVETVRRLNGQVFVLTADEVMIAETPSAAGTATFDADFMAATAPVVHPAYGVQRVLVVVNVDLLQDVHDRQRSLQGEFDADLDAILVHEVYGHAFPYLFAGDMSGRCADPKPGERPEEACSIKRENEVRKELGLFRRTSYSLDALHLSRSPLLSRH
jgi:hypothetical protein